MTKTVGRIVVETTLEERRTFVGDDKGELVVRAELIIRWRLHVEQIEPPRLLRIYVLEVLATAAAWPSA